jgi:tellurite resistance protein
MKTWEETVAAMPLDEAKIQTAIAAYKAMCGSLDNDVHIAWTDAAEALNEREKIELNARLVALP